MRRVRISPEDLVVGQRYGITRKRIGKNNSTRKSKGGATAAAITAAEKRAIKAKAAERTKAHKEAQAERTAALGAKFGMTFAFPAPQKKK